MHQFWKPPPAGAKVVFLDTEASFDTHYLPMAVNTYKPSLKLGSWKLTMPDGIDLHFETEEGIWDFMHKLHQKGGVSLPQKKGHQHFEMFNVKEPKPFMADALGPNTGKALEIENLIAEKIAKKMAQQIEDEILNGLAIPEYMTAPEGEEVQLSAKVEEAPADWGKNVYEKAADKAFGHIKDGSHQTKALSKQADIALSQLSSTAGLLNPDQADKFINLLMKAPTLGKVSNPNFQNFPKKKVSFAKAFNNLTVKDEEAFKKADKGKEFDTGFEGIVVKGPGFSGASLKKALNTTFGNEPGVKEDPWTLFKIEMGKDIKTLTTKIHVCHKQDNGKWALAHMEISDLVMGKTQKELLESLTHPSTVKGIYQFLVSDGKDPTDLDQWHQVILGALGMT
jgi:hypothetical protein